LLRLDEFPPIGMPDRAEPPDQKPCEQAAVVPPGSVPPRQSANGDCSPYVIHLRDLARRSQSPDRAAGNIIPGGAGADWYARGVGGAAACEINEIPTGIPALQGSIFMPVGITTAVDIDRCKLVMPQPGE
jgi:hypothetical protein